MTESDLKKTLFEKVNSLWTEAHDRQTGIWATTLADRKNEIVEATKLFNEWAPLYVYTCVSQAMRTRVGFSLRFEGQEVALIDVRKQHVVLRVTSRTARNNATWFGIDMEGAWDWQGPDATAFRRAFKNLSPQRQGKSSEKRVEAEFLRQMVGDSGKFDGTLKYITPVRVAGCPFQFPVPISANKGYPENGKDDRTGKGNIDILARRGTGAASRLSVWELKAPGAEKSSMPLEQAYIYAATLLKMLRSPSGEIWFEQVLGYGRKLPQRLVIESIAAVRPANDADRALFQQRFAAFKDSTPRIVHHGGFADEIRPIVAYYSEQPLRVELHE